MLNVKHKLIQKGENVMSRIILSLYGFITISLGSLPDSFPLSPGGALVIGIYEQKPNIKNRVTDTGILLTMFEY